MPGVALVAALLAAAAGHGSAFSAPTAGLRRAAFARPRGGQPARLRMRQGSGDAGRWQDVFEDLADPFVSPLEKPALLLKLAQRTPDVVQVRAGGLCGATMLARARAPSRSSHNSHTAVDRRLDNQRQTLSDVVQGKEQPAKMLGSR